MISNILVATDGSETAKRAVNLAADLASRLNVPLTVGHVLQHGAQSEELSRMAESEHMVRHAVSEAHVNFAYVPSNMDTLFTGNLSSAERDRIVAVIGEEIVASAARSAESAGAKSVSTRIANGDYDEGILEMAKEVGADTIVIGHRGLGRLKRIFQGSVSQKINQQADCTVVTVR